MCKDAAEYVKRYARHHCISEEMAMQHEIVRIMIEDYERKERESNGTSSGNQIGSEFKAGGC